MVYLSAVGMVLTTVASTAVMKVLMMVETMDGYVVVKTVLNLVVL